MLYCLSVLLFPPKCVLCRKLLKKDETDLCGSCRIHTPTLPAGKEKLFFLARWTAVWYYRDTVRSSLLRYKFGGKRSYARSYGRLLAMKLRTEDIDASVDLLTWIPISRRRRLRRGYDQVELIARAVAAELSLPLAPTLRKTRHTPPQSGIREAERRRANVLGAYCVPDESAVRGKRILLMDDILTTGATASECAKVLLFAGAKEVSFAAVAATK